MSEGSYSQKALEITEQQIVPKFLSSFIHSAMQEKIVKKQFTYVQDVKYILPATYCCPNSMKIENSTLSLVKKMAAMIEITTKYNACKAKSLF